MAQCKEPLRCQCPHDDGGTCASTAFCLRERGHSGRHKWERHHECWHGFDAWCQMPLPQKTLASPPAPSEMASDTRSVEERRADLEKRFDRWMSGPPAPEGDSHDATP